MFLGDRRVLDIHSVDEPSPFSVTSGAEHNVIPRHLALAHLPRGVVKGPVFETVASFPFHAIARVLVFVPELDGDAVVGEGEKFLAKTVGFLFLPLCGQESYDRVGAFDEGVAVTPDRVRRIRCGDANRIPDEMEVKSDLSISHDMACVQIRYRRDSTTCRHGSGCAKSTAYWVFHRSCAALTFFFADSAVNGGLMSAIVYWMFDGSQP